MNLKFTFIIGFFSSLIIFSSCSIQGTYKDRLNNNYSSDWIKINTDSTFEYITWGHMTGYGYTKGLWKEMNDSIYLTEYIPKIPKTNQLTEINDGNKNIQLIGKDGNPLLPNYIKINGVLDSIKSAWDGNYSYKKFETADRIEVFDLGKTQGEIGQIIADFKTDCNTCSYKIIIDWDEIGFKRVYVRDSIWLYKNNRLYPVDSAIQKSSNGKNRYYKKTDTVKPISLWIKSWNSMKNGYE
ncbi:hypothetical protein [Bizionia arctica]|uniref:hypothetical protein n=1 Tax=Bizionia arctica TaxID=1495645 RepID=UPI00166AFDE9|nr:hypothetical protein [Bizionia arctica]